MAILRRHNFVERRLWNGKMFHIDLACDALYENGFGKNT
jgi:hypothetical protein